MIGVLKSYRSQVLPKFGARQRSLRVAPTRLGVKSLEPAQNVPEEDTISSEKLQSWVHAEEFIAEDEVLLAAREQGEEFGCSPVTPAVGAVLRFLAGALAARAVAEFGTGTGVSGLWLLRGMPDDAVLTTIDHEVEHQRAAKAAFTAAGVRPTQVRAIAGRVQEVAPRLTDNGYDLVVIDADQENLPSYLEQAIRLLRRGGALAIPRALWHDRVPDPARRDPNTVIFREIGRQVARDERLIPLLLTSGDGLLVALKR